MQKIESYLNKYDHLWWAIEMSKTVHMLDKNNTHLQETHLPCGQPICEIMDNPDFYSVNFSEDKQVFQLFFLGADNYFPAIWIGNKDTKNMDKYPVYLFNLNADQVPDDETDDNENSIANEIVDNSISKTTVSRSDKDFSSNLDPEEIPIVEVSVEDEKPIGNFKFYIKHVLTQFLELFPDDNSFIAFMKENADDFNNNDLEYGKHVSDAKEALSDLSQFSDKLVHTDDYVYTINSEYIVSSDED